MRCGGCFAASCSSTTAISRDSSAGFGNFESTRPRRLIVERLRDIGKRLVLENALGGGEALLYLEITRGAAPRIHQFPPEGSRPTVFMMINPFVRARGCANGGAAVVRNP